MKKIVFVFLVSFTMTGCSFNTATKGQIVGKPGDGWECLISGNLDHSALYRYVDEQYGVVIYLGDNYCMTSQKLGKE